MFVGWWNGRLDTYAYVGDSTNTESPGLTIAVSAYTNIKNKHLYVG